MKIIPFIFFKDFFEQNSTKKMKVNFIKKHYNYLFFLL